MINIHIKQKSKKKNDNYIDELIVQQKHQYNPGYYIDGKHSVFSRPTYSRAYGVSTIVINILYLIPLIIIIIVSLNNKSTFEPINFVGFCIFIALYAGVVILYVIAGIRRIKDSSKKGGN